MCLHRGSLFIVRCLMVLLRCVLHAVCGLSLVGRLLQCACVVRYLIDVRWCFSLVVVGCALYVVHGLMVGVCLSLVGSCVCCLLFVV